ncbi:MAG: hypothetical protein QOD07_286 [Frankiaceae bacterium]|nr:hypothetical protein [Frankiaceae bacterium]
MSRTAPPPPPPSSPPPPPPPAASAPPASVVMPYPVAPTTAVARRIGHHKMLYLLGAGLGAVGVLLAAIAIVAKPGPGDCGLTCYRPPNGPPVQAGHPYTSSQFGFAVTYFDEPGGKVSPASQPDSLTLDYGSDGAIQFKGVAASGQTAQQVVESWVSNHLPDAHQAYVLPNAAVGYQLGYGAAYDVAPQGGSGSGNTTRAIVSAAVKGNVAVLAIVLGDYHKYSFENGGLNDGHASAADSYVALFADPIVNTVLWKGDPPR